MKAIGELGTPDESAVVAKESAPAFDLDPSDEEEEPDQVILAKGADILEEIDYDSYKPNIVGNDWILSETDLCMFTLGSVPTFVLNSLLSFYIGRMWRVGYGQ